VVSACNRSGAAANSPPTPGACNPSACASTLSLPSLATTSAAKALSPTPNAASLPILSFAVAVGAASVREIDRINIYHAAVLAMRRALRRLTVAPDHVLVDGNRIRSLGVEHTAVVGGDACCHSIACASIVAKVTRDRLMRALARRHPHYRWETNAGYGTPEHHAGLASHGLTPHHRRSFAPVMQLGLALTVAPPAEGVVLADALHDVLEAPREVSAEAPLEAPPPV
jgi:ribonuclease HII